MRSNILYSNNRPDVMIIIQDLLKKVELPNHHGSARN